MNRGIASSHQFTQCSINYALLFQGTFAFKNRRYNLDFKMPTVTSNFRSGVWDLGFYCLLYLIFNCHCTF